MSVRYIFKCDRCGDEFEQPENPLLAVAVSVTPKDYNCRQTLKPWQQQWCTACCLKVGLFTISEKGLQVMPTEPIVTLESLVREMVQQEVEAAQT